MFSEESQTKKATCFITQASITGQSGKGRTVETEIRTVAAKGWGFGGGIDYKGTQQDFLG